MAVSYLSIADAAGRGVADEQASERRAPAGPVEGANWSVWGPIMTTLAPEEAKNHPIKINGYAIVSDDDKIAGPDGLIPASLRNEKDWDCFQRLTP